MRNLLPPRAAVQEVNGDFAAPTPPDELDIVRDAVEPRRAEFITARACARSALRKLGVEASHIRQGPHGEPLWPAGIVGSITHCRGYRAAVVARSSTDILGLGIDAERHVPLPADVLDVVATPDELPMVADLRLRVPEVHWDTLLFCAKEAAYKAWFPVRGTWLDFNDAAVTLSGSSLTVRLTREGRAPFFSGRWAVRDGLVKVAVIASSGWA